MLYLILSAEPAEDERGSAARSYVAALEDEISNCTVLVRELAGWPERSLLIEEFELLADWFDAQLEQAGRGDVPPAATVITDVQLSFDNDGPPDFAVLSALGNKGWCSAIGMAILAFPELNWLFVSRRTYSPGNDPGDARLARHFCRPLDLADAARRFDQEVSPLFDGSGLRTRVRLVSAEDRYRELMTFDRNRSVIAIDEERSYAWLHAYIAYRFNFRAAAVSSHAGMQRVEQALFVPPEFTFEDLQLEFADGRGAVPSDPEQRAKIYPWLGHTKFRRIVTTDPPSHKAKHALLSALPIALKHLWRSAMGVANEPQRPMSADALLYLAKPSGGMFEIARESGLLINGSASQLMLQDTAPDQHSAPGRLLIIAGRLLRRGRRLYASPLSVSEACRGAVLASDAFELLAGRTPMTALEALALKHQLEVVTECQFVGSEHHIDVISRIKEIEETVAAVSLGSRRNRELVERRSQNASLHILILIGAILRQYGRFNEEALISQAIRELHSDIVARQAGPMGPVYACVSRYFNCLLTDIWRLPVSAALVIAAFGILYWELFQRLLPTVPAAFMYSLVTFFSSSPGPGIDPSVFAHSVTFSSLTTMEICFGFVHLGIFITYLYGLVTRK